MSTIDKVIKIAKNEVGYLEKASRSNLYDKTGNAGSGNYTKYWEEIKPDYQGQPWCAAFVTWCFTEAFGKENASRLLGHYPYVYVPTLAGMFHRYANPVPGDIVCFYRNGEFCHTGIVISVQGDHFETVEGNTSGGSTIIANGGEVARKGYYNSGLPGTKFIRPDYSIIESEELNMTQYEELKKEIADIKNTLANQTSVLNGAITLLNKLSAPMIFNYIDDNMPEWFRDDVQEAVNRGVIRGDENGLNLTEAELSANTIAKRWVESCLAEFETRIKAYIDQAVHK